jgi:2',3'-cyclic-nucleotide 2'-phosphodiesterase (5'-nucleotidase family)
MAIDFTLLHTNDMHNRRSVFPFLERYPRDEATLLVDAGDAIRGSNTVFHFHEPILELMSRVGYDAMTLGNREFHYLRGVLGRRFKQVNFPFVCANLHDLRNKANHFWQPTLIKRIGSAAVGLIGLTPVQYLDESLWQPITGFRFRPPMEVLPPLVAELRPQVDVLILLSHSGFDADCMIARAVEGIDIIVGGHSHTLLEAPRRVGSTCIVQTGSYGRFVGKMAVRIKRDGGMEIADYTLVPMHVAESDQDLLEDGGAA